MKLLTCLVLFSTALAGGNKVSMVNTVGGNGDISGNQIISQQVKSGGGSSGASPDVASTAAGAGNLIGKALDIAGVASPWSAVAGAGAKLISGAIDAIVKGTQTNDVSMKNNVKGNGSIVDNHITSVQQMQ